MYVLIATGLVVVAALAFGLGFALGTQKRLYLSCEKGEKRIPARGKEKVKLQTTGVTLHTPKEEADIEKKLMKKEEEEELEE